MMITSLKYMRCPVYIGHICILSLVIVYFAHQAVATPRWFPDMPSASKNVEVIDLREADPDTTLTMTTLQGLVNRGEEARLYVLLGVEDGFWLEHLQAGGFVASVERLEQEEALRRHGHLIKKRMIYDPELPATINIATMLAALDSGVVVAPSFVWPGDSEPEAEDLRGRWNTSADAYQWALDMLYPRMSRHVIACYHPTACNHRLRDYLVSRQVFHLWVDAPDNQAAGRAAFEAEKAVCMALLEKAPVNTPVLGFWYSGANPGLDEYVGVGLAGEYGKITVVADWSTNLSFLGGVQTDLDHAIATYQKRVQRDPPPFDPDTVYICYDIVESGDAPVYVQDRQRRVWQDSKRGTIPINWSLGPAIFELAPVIAAYYYEQATPADYLYMAISGAGYCHPYRGFMSKTADPEASWTEYLRITAGFLQRMGTRELGLYTDAWRSFEREKQDVITRRFALKDPPVDALILGMGRDEKVDINAANYRMEGLEHTLVSHIMTRWPTDYAEKSREDNIAWLVNDIREHTPSEGALFMHVMALSWVFGPSEIAEVQQLLGEQYVPLTLPQFTELYRQHAH